MAALVASGESQITGLPFLNRGYENLVEKLSSLGADISIIENPLEPTEKSIKKADKILSTANSTTKTKKTITPSLTADIVASSIKDSVVVKAIVD
jgi:hypothetical protein